MATSYTERIRTQLRETLNVKPPCPNCGRPFGTDAKQIEEQTGLKAGTVKNFLDGKPIRMNSLDKIVEYLETQHTAEAETTR